MDVSIKVKVEQEKPYSEFKFEDDIWFAKTYRGYEKSTHPFVVRGVVQEIEASFLEYIGALMIRHDLTGVLRISEIVYKGKGQLGFLIGVGVRKVEVTSVGQSAKKHEAVKDLQYCLIYRKGGSVIIHPIVNKAFSNWDEILNIFSAFKGHYGRKGFNKIVGGVVIQKELPRAKR